MLSQNLEQTLHRSLSFASERRHEYATLEHLLLGLATDIEVVATLRACEVDVAKLCADLTEFLDKDTLGLATDRSTESKPTAGFQRVVQRAAIHVQVAGKDPVSSLDVLLALFHERESHAAYFLELQNLTRQKLLSIMSDASFETDAVIWAEPPPKLPSQGIGPHVEINPEGVIDFSPAESLDHEGNHLSRLRALHPELRALSYELVADLSRGNSPHAILGERVAAYAALVDQDLEMLDFRRLYSAGVRLANAAYATGQAISSGDLPSLGPAERERLESLLALHGPFILSTSAGSEAMLYEERYRRRPAEEEQYRIDAVAMAASLQGHPDLIDPEVAKQLLDLAQEIAQGDNPERSIVAGNSMIRNVTISIASGAIGSAALIYAGPLMSGVGAIAASLRMLTISETIKKTSWFKLLTNSLATSVDDSMDASSSEALNRFRSGLRRHYRFVTANEPMLRRLAGTRKDFSFLHQALDWLKNHSKKTVGRH